MADENKVEAETTEQESPTVESNQTETEEVATAEKPEETPTESSEVDRPEDKNWKAVREELDRLKEENRQLKGEDRSNIDQAKSSEVVQPLLSNQDQINLQFDEFKAQTTYPELDVNSDKYNKLFDIAVAGQYRAELDSYARGLMTGRPRPLPSATKIAKDLKKEWDIAFNKQGTQVKNEVLKQVQKSVEKKEATVEAEGRSDRRNSPSSDMESMRQRSRQGDVDAIATRLTRSHL